MRTSELEREERKTFSNVYVIHTLLDSVHCGQGDGGSQRGELGVGMWRGGKMPP